MPRLSQKARKRGPDRATLAATRINDVMCFFHAAPLLYCLDDGTESASYRLFYT